ncbi:hypothetical protein NC652_023047 [Populus alba x Populus x berolinensis]|nr:hypothetical protein NC652_023047 [Populus alba x Populus x berolinensis]
MIGLSDNGRSFDITAANRNPTKETEPIKINNHPLNVAVSLNLIREKTISLFGTNRGGAKETGGRGIIPENKNTVPVDVDASSSPRAPLPKIKSAITGGSASPSLSAPKKTKGRGFREEVDTERQSRFSGRGFDSLGSDGGPGPQRLEFHEEAQDDHLQEAFGEFGEIKNLHLNLDRRTGFVKKRSSCQESANMRRGKRESGACDNASLGEKSLLPTHRLTAHASELVGPGRVVDSLIAYPSNYRHIRSPTPNFPVQKPFCLFRQPPFSLCSPGPSSDLFNEEFRGLGWKSQLLVGMQAEL